MRYVNAMGWHLVGEFVDNDVSATSGKRRPEFERMMALVDEGAVDVVVVRHLDRLLRRMIELETVLERCVPHGVRVISTGEGIDTGTDGGRTTARILCSVAQGEVERKSARQRSAAEQAARLGRWVGGRRPFGYEADGVTVRETEAALIRQAYDDILVGESCHAIARRWNALGVMATQKKRDGSGEPARWSHSTVRDVLTNPRHAGLRRYRPGASAVREKRKDGTVWSDRAAIRQNPRLGIVGKAEWPALVPEETWYAAVDVLTNPARWKPAKGGKRLLTGVATCGVPGCGLYVHGGAAGHGKPGYRCRSGAHIARLAEPIDQYIELLALKRLLKPDAVAVFARPAEKESAVPLVRELEGVRRRLDEVPLEFADGVLDARQLKLITTRLREREADLQQRIAQLGQTDVIGPLIVADNIEDAWRSLSTARKRTVISLLFEQVVIHPVGRGVRNFRPTSVTVVWRNPATAEMGDSAPD